MQKNRIIGIINQLSTVVEAGVSVIVVTKPPEEFKEKIRETVVACAELLQRNGIIVKYKADFYQKFTVIDQSVVWYGSVNVLGFGKSEECIMRFHNTDVACRLTEAVT